MLTIEKILKTAKEKGEIRTSDFTRGFGVSRQYASQLIRRLVITKELIKICSTRSPFYILPEYAGSHSEILPSHFSKTYTNKNLEEHKVLEEIEKMFYSEST